MSELNVFFWGLVCHMDNAGGDSKFDFAALVEAQGHQPRLIFGPKPKDNYKLKSHVSFEHGTRAADSEPANTSFADFVPNLRQIVGGAPALGFSSPYLFYYPDAGGLGRPKLSVIDTYDYTARHRSKSTGKVKRAESLVGRVIRLRVPLAIENVKVLFKGTNKLNETVTYKDIPADSCILVTNLPDSSLYEAAALLSSAGEQLLSVRRDKTISDAAASIEMASLNLKHYALHATSSSMNDFEYYTTLLSTADVAIAEPVRYVTPPPPTYPNACSWVPDYIDDLSLIILDGAAPECGNTQWP